MNNAVIFPHCTMVRIISEGVTKLFPKGFDELNSIFIYPHGKKKLCEKFHMSALNFPSFLFFFFFSIKTFILSHFQRSLAFLSMYVNFVLN